MTGDSITASGKVSNQLISLTSRESSCLSGMEVISFVSNQLISLTSREIQQAHLCTAK